MEFMRIKTKKFDFFLPIITIYNPTPSLSNNQSHPIPSTISIKPIQSHPTPSTSTRKNGKNEDYHIDDQNHLCSVWDGVCQQWVHHCTQVQLQPTPIIHESLGISWEISPPLASPLIMASTGTCGKSISQRWSTCFTRSIASSFSTPWPSMGGGDSTGYVRGCMPTFPASSGLSSPQRTKRWWRSMGSGLLRMPRGQGGQWRRKQPPHQ